MKKLVSELKRDEALLGLRITFCNLYKWRKLNRNTTNKKEY